MPQIPPIPDREVARQIAETRKTLAAETACSHGSPCQRCQEVNSGRIGWAKSYPYHYGLLASRVELLLAALGEAAPIAAQPAATYRPLALEVKDQADGTADVGAVMITPAIDEDYWLFRVKLSGTQAIVGFPKFGTIGIGFAEEEDWNANLPYTCDAGEIYGHIAHNQGDDASTSDDVVAAIRLVQAAAGKYMAAQR